MKYDLHIHKLISFVAFLSLIALFLFAEWEIIIASIVYSKLVVSLFCNQIAQHRFFSHRSFKTDNIRHWGLYLISLTTGINPVQYAIAHRHHHTYSDTKDDIHSVHNHWYDIFSPVTNHIRPANIKIFRVLQHATHRKISSYWWIIFLIYCGLFAIIDWTWIFYFAFAGVAMNYLHMTLVRAWLVHIKLPGSYRNFDTPDQSWNNKWLQLIDLGEGLHNNHHKYPTRYSQATESHEFDPAAWIIKNFLEVKES